MPFTASHPAAVLPFVGSRLPASALVIGSLAPDLPYYVGVYGLPTHLAWSVATVDVVIGFAAWVAWHGLLAAPAVDAAPRALRARLPVGAADGVRARLRSVAAAWVLVALAVGSATHVAVDVFTHRGMWGARHIPALARQWGPLPGYWWLQWAGSIAGAAVLVWWAVRWWRRTAPRRDVEPGRCGWGLWAVAGAGTVGLAAGLAAASARGGAVNSMIFLGATYGGGFAAAAWAALACGWYGRRLWRKAAV